MLVKIKPEFCDNEKESDILFNVVEDNGDRLLIEPVEWKWYIKPQEIINREYVRIIEP